MDLTFAGSDLQEAQRAINVWFYQDLFHPIYKLLGYFKKGGDFYPLFKSVVKTVSQRLDPAIRDAFVNDIFDDSKRIHMEGRFLLAGKYVNYSELTKGQVHV